MNTTDIDNSAQREAFADRLVGDLTASMETLGVWLGLRLGLYEAMDRVGAGTAAELASTAGIDPRYAREWLEQQAVAGVLVTTDAGCDAEDRRYALPTPHREVLLDQVSPYFVAPATYALASFARVLPELLTAYRTGAGVPFATYGEEIRDHIEQFNRPMFVNDLATHWLPAVPDLHARLGTDPPARVADIACGAGWASIALAQGYPKARVDGFDLDAASIRRAKRNAAAAGVDDRVSFAVRNAADPQLTGRYDAAMIFEALHDLARPVEALAAARALLADGGCLIIGDERVAETFTAPGNEVERLMYGFSILHCLPVSRTETPSAATGTVLRPATLRAYATQAGFAEVEVLPVENDMWRFYRLAG
ncbi:MAG: class I SAM-dependent methyltransferase [Pseudonocardiaceae bacterium]